MARTTSKHIAIIVAKARPDGRDDLLSKQQAKTAQAYQEKICSQNKQLARRQSGNKNLHHAPRGKKTMCLVFLRGRR